jgi:pimeloyl-ACP methyl ester carboxylesterase
MTTPSQVESVSADGTVVTCFVEGDGPALVLVHGSTADHSRWTPLIPLLRDDFTVYALDRRGRGASAREAGGYAIEREGEDLLAVVAGVPGPAMVFGHSYGASVTLSVLDRLSDCAAILLYEPAFSTPGRDVFTDDQLARWSVILAEGRREALLEAFYREALLFDDAAIDALRPLPIWPARIAAVHTLVREAAAVRSFRPPSIAAPAPLRFLVGDSTAPHLTASTYAAAAAVGDSELEVLVGQGHVAIDAVPEVVAGHVRDMWMKRRQ